MVMFTKITYNKICLAIFLLFTLQFSFASFTGTVDEKNKNNKFTLKNLNKISKNYSLSYLHGDFQFKGYQDLTQKKINNSLEVSSMIRLEKGTTTYVYPYTYKIKVPKFKTPAPPPGR